MNPWLLVQAGDDLRKELLAMQVPVLPPPPPPHTHTHTDTVDSPPLPCLVTVTFSSYQPLSAPLPSLSHTHAFHPCHAPVSPILQTHFSSPSHTHISPISHTRFTPYTHALFTHTTHPFHPYCAGHRSVPASVRAGGHRHRSAPLPHRLHGAAGALNSP